MSHFLKICGVFVKFGCRVNIISVFAAVSYTHLDVYKRQLIGYEQAASENLEAAKEKYSFIFE